MSPKAKAKRATEKRAGKMTSVPCAFCQGSGKDPFRLLSPLALCGVCGGTGQVEVEKPYVPCAFCGGRGIHPRSRLTCTACMGKGVIAVKEPVERCPTCHGLGRDCQKGADLFCTTCLGAGVVSI